MTRRALRPAGWLAALVVVAGLVPSAQAQVVLVPGNFTYQFTDVNRVPLTGPILLNVGDFFNFQVHFVQTGGTPTLTDRGLESTGVRLNYPGGVVRVPAATSANIIANPLYDFVIRGGVGSSQGAGADTSTSATLFNGVIAEPIPFPSQQTPPDTLRMLIGTFKIQALASGTVNIEARDLLGPPNISNIMGASATAPSIELDPFLAEYAAVPIIPRLTVTVAPVPEPSTLALAGLATMGLAALRRRKAAVATAV